MFLLCTADCNVYAHTEITVLTYPAQVFISGCIRNNLYVIFMFDLQVKKSSTGKEMNIHFWLGSETTQVNVF